MNQKKIAMLFKEILYRDTPINDDGQSYFLLKKQHLNYHSNTLMMLLD